MHAVDVLVALALLAQLERLSEVVPDRGREPADLLARQLGRELERRQVRPAKDLIRVCPADTGDRPLVAEERMKLPSLATQDLGQPLLVHGERVGPEMGEVLRQPLRRDQPTPARFFDPASVRTSSPPSAKRTRNIGRFGLFRPASDIEAVLRSSGGRGRRGRRLRAGRAGSCRAARHRRARPPSSTTTEGRSSSAWRRGQARLARPARAGRADRAPHPGFDLRQLEHCLTPAVADPLHRGSATRKTLQPAAWDSLNRESQARES